MAKPSNRELHALRNLISEVDLILSTTTLPEGRTKRCRELLKSAIALTEDFIEQANLSPAAAMGHKGGSATAKRFGAIDGMAAGDWNAGLAGGVGAAAHDFAQNLERQFIDRPGDEAERPQRFAAHGVDIRERVGGGDTAELEGVVHHRGEKIGGLRQPFARRQLVNACVV